MKHFNLIKTFLLLFALVVGGGSSAWADTYEQLTSIANIDESAEYVLGIDGTGFHYEGTSSWGKTALPSAQTPIYYTLKKASDGNSFTAEATIGDTKYYLQIPTSNTFSMATSAGTNTNLIIGTTQVSGTNYAVANKTTTARHLRINGTSGLRSYAGTTGNMAYFYKIVPDAPAYTITASSNNDSWGTVSLSGSVITATPAEGYTYADPAYSVNPANSATVAQDGNKFTVTPSADTEITINFVALPKYTVTFSDGGSVTQASFGAKVTLPTRSAISSYTFAGWSETNVPDETTTAPTIIPAGDYTPAADITLYPVYSKTEGASGVQNKTASVTISDYATANNWKNSTQYTSVTLDENATITASGGGNTGKYYTNGSDWRFYQNETAKAIINLSNGNLTSATFTYEISNGGVLKYNDSNLSSGTSVNLSGTSAEFTVGNTSSATNGQVKFTAITVNYTIGNPGTTYYWSTPVAATVERPEITLAANPFTFSTTATITCATNGAAIKYSYDGTNWNDYSSPLTITESKTIYAKAVLGNDESQIATVTATKNLVEPTVTIDATGITNTNIFAGTDAGSLSASVTYNDAAIEGAAVTWSGNNDEVATINASTGAVTLVGAGSVIFTATYAGNGDYSEKTASYNMTVIYDDPNAPGTINNPLTVADVNSGSYSGDNYVTGYIVGYFVSKDDDASNSGKPNLALSDTPEEKSGANTIAIQLPSGSLRTSWNIEDNNVIGYKVLVRGNITGYFTGKTGVKNTSEISAVSVPVSISAAGYATYCSNYPLDFTGITTLTAYTASVEDNAIKFNKVEGKVPANTGLLVSGETTNVPVCASADPVTNLLVGVTTETVKDANTIFVLMNGSKGIGFYKNSNAFTVRANSAYLPAEAVGTAGARAFIGFDDETTGIAEMNTQKEDAKRMFDLQGRKVTKAAKGLYIVDGRKVVVK